VRDQREPLVTSQLTPSQAAITEAALGRSFIFAQHSSGMTFLRIVIPLYLFVCMIFPENRYPLFRIMLYARHGWPDDGGSSNSQRYSNAA
jgi:hypothetical protein